MSKPISVTTTPAEELEGLARRWCHAMALDPDEIVILDSGNLAVLRKGPRWRTVVPKIKEALALKAALADSK